MRLTIIAATGGVGRELLEQAVATGHDVTAVVRDPRKLARPVRTVTADMAAADPAALEPAVAGADAMLSGLGSHSNADAGIAARAPGPSWRRCRLRACGGSSQSAPRRSPPSPCPETPARPSTTQVTGSSCGTCSATQHPPGWARSSPTWRRWRTSWPAAAWTGPSSGRRSWPASPHRHLPHRLRPEHPRRPVRPPRRRRPPHAPGRWPAQTIRQAIGIAS